MQSPSPPHRARTSSGLGGLAAPSGGPAASGCRTCPSPLSPTPSLSRKPKPPPSRRLLPRWGWGRRRAGPRPCLRCLMGTTCGGNSTRGPRTCPSGTARRPVPRAGRGPQSAQCRARTRCGRRLGRTTTCWTVRWTRLPTAGPSWRRCTSGATAASPPRRRGRARRTNRARGIRSGSGRSASAEPCQTSLQQRPSSARRAPATSAP
mmetsp:Transcript_8527/g.21309  ORF Transcript_8527/g.21309 Transcript_8527/m.21309 type:complete len:206 (+) Transcript_8527:313-930(+)